MNIPRNGRYVVRAELTGFTPVTQEVVLGPAPGDTSATAQIGSAIPMPTGHANPRPIADSASSHMCNSTAGNPKIPYMVLRTIPECQSPDLLRYRQLQMPPDRHGQT